MPVGSERCLKRTKFWLVEHGSDGFGLCELVGGADHGDPDQGAGDVVVSEGWATTRHPQLTAQQQAPHQTGPAPIWGGGPVLCVHHTMGIKTDGRSPAWTAARSMDSSQ